MKQSHLYMLIVAVVAAVAGTVIAVNYVSSDFDDINFPKAMANESSDEVNGINAKIKENGAKWSAAMTEISKLAPAERKKRVMTKEQLAEKLDTVKDAKGIGKQVFGVLPPSFDFRTYSDSAHAAGAYVSAVKNQGSCGSCWDFGATAAAESAILLANSTPFAQNPIDLSEQVMLSCGNVGTCNGGGITGPAGFLTNTGSPLESCYAYTATDGNCANACANWQNNTYKVTGFSYVADRTVDGIKNVLASGKAMYTAMNVYSDFYSYRSGVYTHVSGTDEGGHVVQVVGYDDANQCFIFKNSWGTGWGEAGFFRMAYSELGKTLAYNFYTFSGAINPLPSSGDNTAPTVSISSPVNGTTVFDTVGVTVAAKDNVGVSKVELYVNGSLYGSFSGASYTFSWQSRSIANGGVNLVAKAYDTSGNVGSSDTVTVNVNNAADTVAPAVTIVSPANGATVSGNTAISASASDGGGVVSMKCYVDGRLVSTAAANALSYNWNANKAAAGAHTIKVDAADFSGNIGTASISVTTAGGAGGKKK